MIKIANKREAERLFGLGIYTPAEAACYARVPTALMTRWIHGSKRGAPVVQAQVSDTEDKIVTFLDFVQALAIRRIKTEHPGISLHKIRQAHDTAISTFHINYPFALKSTRIGLFGPSDRPDLQEIWLSPPGDDLEESFAKYFVITGKDKKNQLIGEVVRTYTVNLVFDDTTELAQRYFPFPAGITNAKGSRIVMDPEVRFGEPFVESCGYTTQTLYDAYQSEKSIARASEICGVTPEEITLAIEFVDYIQKKPSAA